MLDVSVRKEVLDFILASEALLSPVLRPADLTKAECDTIAEYVKNLSATKHPWSKSLPVRYNP